jgi:hypothetical protein
MRYLCYSYAVSKNCQYDRHYGHYRAVTFTHRACLNDRMPTLQMQTTLVIYLLMKGGGGGGGKLVETVR